MMSKHKHLARLTPVEHCWSSVGPANAEGLTFYHCTMVKAGASAMDRVRTPNTSRVEENVSYMTIH